MTSPPTRSDRSSAAIFLKLAHDPNHISSVFDGFNVGVCRERTAAGHLTDE